eukprot:TRINITY_DN517_c0_g1_i2.p1 TRINITY_DN517_c0_g1~~TRINITY_DN517_c0_g1_i2.p1  ORF type:complete len:317 (-),score=57.95 TRINITY_DN517_c0_g1_i2:63-1013(-)
MINCGLKHFRRKQFVLFFDQAAEIIVIGLDDGQIVVEKLYSDTHYIKHDQYAGGKVHSSRVTGVCYDNLSNQCYSIGEDKFLKIFDCTRNEIVSSLPVSTHALRSLSYDKDAKRIFVTNNSNQVYIYDIQPKCQPMLLHIIDTGSASNNKALHYDISKRYLFTAGYNNGLIQVYEIGKAGKEKFTKQIMQLPGKNKERTIKWSKDRLELYVGNEDGTITFWNAKKAKPFFVLKAHDDAVTQLFYNEAKQLLISSGKDKKLKFWKLPFEWRDPKLEAEEEKEAAYAKQTQTLMKFKEQQKKAAVDSDEDDLANWHKF